MKLSFLLRMRFTTAMFRTSNGKEQVRMARKFRELEATMSPEDIRASDSIHERLKEDMALDELRDAVRMTQEQLAKALKVDQSAISKLERRTDMYVSTLERCIAAMGGRLEIRAVFPEGTVRISQFEKLTRE